MESYIFYFFFFQIAFPKKKNENNKAKKYRSSMPIQKPLTPYIFVPINNSGIEKRPNKI